MSEHHMKARNAAHNANVYAKDAINSESTLPEVIASAILATDAAKEAERAYNVIKEIVDNNAKIDDQVFALEQSEEAAKRAAKDAFDARKHAENKIDEMIDSALAGNFKKVIKEKLKIES